MGMIYKITDKVWGVSDMPWPFFYGIQTFVILKIIIGSIILCFVTITYPLFYGLGIWYLFKKKKKPNLFYFVLYTALMGWYIFLIIKYLILGYPFPINSRWSGEKQSINQYSIEQPYEIKHTPNGEEFSEGKVYKYRVKIEDAKETLITSNIQRSWRNEPQLKMSASQLKKMNGIYEWQSTIFFETQRQMFDYICEHFHEMQKFKIESLPVNYRKLGIPQKKNLYDEYNDRLDEYLDDPEDEIRFDPEIFDFQDD